MRRPEALASISKTMRPGVADTVSFCLREIPAARRSSRESTIRLEASSSTVVFTLAADPLQFNLPHGFNAAETLLRVKDFQADETALAIIIRRNACLLYTSDAADDLLCVDLG